ncbi:hypothetical protein [Aureliella helgolandensis]|uniref:hypothetical protein n=1 Tax=Aureliella helgolandensis TaxID=2527968 RepID=UPI0011A80415|nr:hypothetical protein [Aureliella helgolandensis]
MSICQPGKLSCSKWVFSPLWILLFSLWFQASPVYGQDPSAPSLEAPLASALAVPEIEFDQRQFPLVREGYLSLKWQPVESATTYAVIDDEQREVYRGVWNSAFLSGLGDGEYAFHVEAYDAAGGRLAQTSVPAQVKVEHWPLAQAMTLFAIGLILFVLLLVVIAGGATLGKRSQVAHDERMR